LPLFIIRHQHSPDSCPAQDPLLGASLLNHLSRPNVRKFGVRIQGEAVVQGEHIAYFIVEAADEGRVRAFMQPFQMAGSLDIYPASTCVRAVASGGCGAPAPAVGDAPTLEELKKRYIRHVLERSRGNISRAAAVLGLERRSLYRMLQRYGIAPRGNAEG